MDICEQMAGGSFTVVPFIHTHTHTNTHTHAHNRLRPTRRPMEYQNHGMVKTEDMWQSDMTTGSQRELIQVSNTTYHTLSGFYF